MPVADVWDAGVGGLAQFSFVRVGLPYFERGGQFQNPTVSWCERCCISKPLICWLIM